MMERQPDTSAARMMIADRGPVFNTVLLPFMARVILAERRSNDPNNQVTGADDALEVDTSDWVSITVFRNRGHVRKWSHSPGGISGV
jgi:hypothetical protein